ncbi:magnesium transporter [Microbacterium ulmi]|uniref:Magnesium transporter MgtE n=1 Tax=Microbacterium ulmi TaxID=179095 RepID=A0A7Y2LX87_9MICO|nr:magnesium transporter [Microbacterium ulmi]NII71128.1 magnesium transporter [Microbacterium ulmi]NNH02435.1 magnesium transporter [Microbacterium ulmi]
MATRTEFRTRTRELADRLDGMDASATALELGRMSRADRAVSFRSLPKTRAIEVFEALDPSMQADLVGGLRSEQVAEIIEDLDPDDRAELFDELPAGLVNTLLSGLSPQERALTDTLLGYPHDSAGRRMSPEVASISERATVGEAVADVRRQAATAETIYTIPVLGAGRTVVGVVSLRDLFSSADPRTPVRELMSAPAFVRATDDQEAAARTVRAGGYVAVPVVDDEQRLLGILTVDDAMRILDEEEAEDDALSGGSSLLGQPYLAVGPLRLFRKRIVWLLVLIGAAALTVGVQTYFEDTLAEVVALALFIPLLVGTGGNAGAQAGTTLVRALAVGEVRTGDLVRVVGREAVAGALEGLTLAVVAFVPAMLLTDVGIATVVSVTILGICTLATTIGAAVPIVAKAVGIDPALVCSPFITTIVDTSGLIIYFLVARAVLGL